MKVLLLLVGILLHVSLQVSAVEMLEGESVQLPCDFPTFDVDQPTVLWTRSDLSPSTVYQLQLGGDQLKDQNQLYRGRTSMNTDALETGDLSLNLIKLQLSDTGTYTCTVRTSRGQAKVTDIELLVKERFPSWAKVLLALLVLVIIVFGGLLFHFRHYFMSVPQVEVDSDVESVLLPCRTTVKLPEDAKVEWKDSRDRKVYVFRNGSDQTEEQDLFYKNRSKMNEDLLSTGDLSLTLEHPSDGDTNSTYTCSISSRKGNILMKKKVNLKIKVPQVEVDSGVESVLLPCRITVNLPEDAKVEWRDSRQKKVHVWKKDSDQHKEETKSNHSKQDEFYKGRTEMNEDLLKTGDLSLTLKQPTDEDSGTYTCIVSNREGKILMEKRVDVRFKVPQVEVDSGMESVLLPCRTRVNLPGDAKVEWIDTDNRKVHVWKKDSDQCKEETESNHSKQDEFYVARTEMNEDPLRTGDLSLTLKHPTDKDSSTYTCIVWDGKILMKKQVHLLVKVSHQVEVDSGAESVLLPCRTKPNLAEVAKVEWWDKDNRKVHVWKKDSDQRKEETESNHSKQDEFYVGRTEMNEDPLRTGDLSLTLKHPTNGHSKIFTCIVSSNEGNILMKKQVNLKVTVTQVVVSSGVESVLLPCRTRANLPEDATVEWRDSSYRKVHVYKNGYYQPEEQDQFYRARSKTNKDLLKTGNLSLTLEHPTDGDSNIYTCTVSSREGNMLTRKRVHLHIKVCHVEVEEGEESVLLSFTTTPDLPGDTQVEWKDRNDRKVHVFKKGSEQPEEQSQFYRNRTKMNEGLLKTGDLSLTLKHPTKRDSGEYICDARMERIPLRLKTVVLIVKGPNQPNHTKNRSSSADLPPLMEEEKEK